MVRTMEFLTVEPSSLHIIIPLEPEYSPQDPVFKDSYLHYSFNIRDRASHPYNTTGNIIVLYILIFKFFERNREEKSVWTE